jgi:hypothetical protein
VAASSFRVRSRLARAFAVALPFAAAACSDSPTGTGGDLNATSLASASSSVDAALDEPVLLFLLQGAGSGISFDDPTFVPSRMNAASSLLRTRGGSTGQATLATSALASGVRAQIARAVVTSGSGLFESSMYGVTYVATPDSVYRDEAATGAPANGFAIVLMDAASATVGTIEVRDSSTASVAKQAITIRDAAGAGVAQYSESMTGSVSETGPSSITAQSQGTIGGESKVAFSRSLALTDDGAGNGSLVLASQYTLPGGARTGVEVRFVTPAQGAVSSVTLSYGRSTFRLEIPSVADATAPNGWGMSDTTRVIADGRLVAYVIASVSQDGMQAESSVVAPDGGPLSQDDLIVMQRAQEFAGKLLQVDFVVGAVENWVSNVIAYVQMIP